MRSTSDVSVRRYRPNASSITARWRPARSTLHSTGTNLVTDCLRQAFDADFHVRVQNPLAADDYSEPEPDVVIVTGAIRDYRNAHPTSAVLIVETSNESLRHDRTVKQRPYARYGIPEYWILALPDARLEIQSDPAEDGYPHYLHAYRRRPHRPARPPRRTDRQQRSPALT